MKRILFISVVCVLAFFFQFFIFNILGPWGTPNFLIICVIFFDLYWGVRYSLWVAFLGGFLLDIFSLAVLGSHIFALMLCAYIAIFLRRNFYQPGSFLSRAFVVGVSVCVYSFVLTILRTIYDESFSVQDIFYALISELVLTALAANISFNFLRKWTDQSVSR